MPLATIADLAVADRILFHGVTGSGKSTAALRLGEVLGLPVHLVDEEIGWLPGWTQRDVDEQRSIAADIATRPRWVIDSTYSSFRDPIIGRADVVVALDYPRWLSLGRLLLRTCARLVTRVETCNGNTESLRQVVSADSIIRWHFTSFTRKREQSDAWAAATTGPGVLRLTHPRDLDAVVAALQSRPPSR